VSLGADRHGLRGRAGGVGGLRDAALQRVAERLGVDERRFGQLLSGFGIGVERCGQPFELVESLEEGVLRTWGGRGRDTL
jgi:hypothetical protein